MTDTERYITTLEAAERAEVTEATIIGWCKGRYRALGIKVGGRWRINPSVLGRVLNGTFDVSRKKEAI